MDDFIKIKAYNLETILAEKLQTVFNKSIYNSRSKDFYDIYIIHKLKIDQINTCDLRKAFLRTCAYRKTDFTKKYADGLLNTLAENEQMLTRWKNYIKKNAFAKGIEFKTVITSCKNITNLIFKNK